MTYDPKLFYTEAEIELILWFRKKHHIPGEFMDDWDGRITPCPACGRLRLYPDERFAQEAVELGTWCNSCANRKSMKAQFGK